MPGEFWLPELRRIDTETQTIGDLVPLSDASTLDRAYYARELAVFLRAVTDAVEAEARAVNATLIAEMNGAA